MENHPIPQDVTGFQFKLIGDMTIKQFAYLALGVIFAWVFYLFPVAFLIKLPFLLFSAGFGAALAFVPYEGRPLDTMIKNFFKALTNPTQFVYQKAGGHFYFPPLPQIAQTAKIQQATSLSGKNLQDYLKSLPQKSHNKLDDKEMLFFQSLSGLHQTPTLPMPPLHVVSHPVISTPPPVHAEKPEPQHAPQPTSPQDQNEKVLREETAHLQQELEKAKKEEQQQKASPAGQEAHQKVLELEQELNNITQQKASLEEQLIELQKKLVAQKAVFTPSLAMPQQETKNVHSVPFAMAKNIGLPQVSEAPNVITGIIKDPRGNPLSNILVEVKDAQGNPVRAFKTNPLGQFASATPLLNNIYTIEFEDPKNQQKFDTIEVQATGEPIPPLEVISSDAREDLRRSLFGNANK